jgi:pimeloyl-ACP methyl ester carboxylesterase
MSRLGADTVALLDHLQVNQAVLVGCSIGGYVLLELWRQAPRRIRGLAFVCSKPQPDAEANLAKRATTIAQARAGSVSALFDGMTQSLIGATVREQRAQIVSELRAHMTLSPEALVAVQAGLATRPDSIPTVATIEVPVLAIAGAEDSVVTPAEMEAFRPAPGGCQYHVLPNSGHFAAYEHPSEVAALLRPWLRKLER